MRSLHILKPGDSVEVIAPASRCTDKQLADIKELLTSWELNCIIQPDIFGDDLLCANSDSARFKLLKNALENSHTKAIICARGGYGCMRLIPKLAQLQPPAANKLFVGMSDITALNLFLQQKWQWPVIHSSGLTRDKFSSESISAVKAIFFGEKKDNVFLGTALNSLAEQHCHVRGPITGGNLCLVQTSIGTLWQIDTRNKIIFLEEVNERGYRIDRMLEHLQQAGLFDEALAIVLGDFLEGNEPDGSSLVQPVLERFAQNCKIPVIQVKNIGHGFVNFPLVLGVEATLKLGKQVSLEEMLSETTCV